MNENNLIPLQPDAHSKEEITTLVTEWCNKNGDTNDLQKYIQLKELMKAGEIGIEILKPKAKRCYLDLLGGAMDKSNFYGATVSTQSCVKKNTLAKTYLFSPGTMALQKEVETMEAQLKIKKDALNGLKLMEIDNGTATELTAEALVGGEVAPVETPIEDTFNLVITLRDK